MRCALQSKPFVNTVGNSLLSGGLSSKLHPQCCECSSNTVTCYKADPVRYRLNVSGLCWADLRRTGWAGVKDARPCLNVSAFFGGGTHRLLFGTAATRSWRRSENDSSSYPAICFISRPQRTSEWAAMISATAQKELPSEKSHDFYHHCREFVPIPTVLSAHLTHNSTSS